MNLVVVIGFTWHHSVLRSFRWVFERTYNSMNLQHKALLKVLDALSLVTLFKQAYSERIPIVPPPTLYAASVAL